jgi:protein-disulfide isomerase
MASPDKLQKLFLLGSIVLGVLIIGGLIWAIASGPGPVPPRVFNDTNDPVFGADTEKVVRIFGDFQCPACRAAESGVTYALETYKDKVRFIWNDFPLQSIHPNALLAANAARCAEAQGKFWEYHDRLYGDQPSWDNLSNPAQKFKDYANALGLQTESFSTCLDKQEHQQKIMDDLSEGERNGVNATPYFFVGNTPVVGILTNADWDKNIQAYLAAATSTSTP